MLTLQPSVKRENVDASAACAGADGGGAGAAPARALQSSATKVWKFMAVQLTYNSSHGDFASLEETVLRQLFSRFLAFLAGLARELKAEGTSATMEKASPLQVHLHAYLHLAQPFHRHGRDALPCKCSSSKAFVPTSAPTRLQARATWVRFATGTSMW